MKLKGERELQAEQLYNSLEMQLANFVKGCATEIKNTNISDSQGFDKYIEASSTIAQQSYKITIARLFTMAILEADIDLREVSGLLRYFGKSGNYEKAVNILIDNPDTYNIGDKQSLLAFIKLLSYFE